MIFLNIRTNFVSVVKLLPVYNMASSGLWKMLTFIILKHQNGVWENVFHIILTPNIFYAFWQMLCLLVSKADVICLADVNALYVLADVIAKR